MSGTMTFRPARIDDDLRTYWWRGAMMFVRGEESPPGPVADDGTDPGGDVAETEEQVALWRGYTETAHRFQDLGFEHVRAEDVQVGWYVARDWKPGNAQVVLSIAAKGQIHFTLGPTASGDDRGMRLKHGRIVLASRTAQTTTGGPRIGPVAGRPGLEVICVAPCQFLTHEAKVPVVVYRDNGEVMACSLALWYQVTRMPVQASAAAAGRSPLDQSPLDY